MPTESENTGGGLRRNATRLAVLGLAAGGLFAAMALPALRRWQTGTEYMFATAVILAMLVFLATNWVAAIQQRPRLSWALSIAWGLFSAFWLLVSLAAIVTIIRDDLLPRQTPVAGRLIGTGLALAICGYCVASTYLHARLAAGRRALGRDRNAGKVEDAYNRRDGD